MDARLWSTLDAMVERSPSMADLFHHRLGGVAAHRLRALGRPLPAPLAEEEHFASFSALAAPVVLGRIAAVCAQPVLVLKGPEVAARYPAATMRPSLDLDVLVEDAPGVHAALVRAGCTVVDETPSGHHELPLVFPDLPLVIEVHSAPKWPSWGSPPATAELLAAAVPFRGDAPVLAPPGTELAVLLAAHSWAHRPLTRLLDLVDVLVVEAETEPEMAATVARRWGVERLWEATLDAARGTLITGKRPWTMATWGRNTLAVRRPRRREELLERCLSPFAALPARRAAGASAAAIAAMALARAHGGHAERVRQARPEHPSLVAARARGESAGDWDP